MNVLITGVNGFIGSYLANYLTKQGHSVFGVGRKSCCDNKNIVYFQTDLVEGFSCEAIIDCIIHAAGQSPYNAKSMDDYVRNNVLSAEKIAAFACKKNVKKIIYLSSISVYGDVEAAVVDEKTPIINSDVYGLTKHMAEKIFEEASRNVPCISLRLPGVLGDGAHTPWIATLKNKAAENLDLCISNPNAYFNNAVDTETLASFIVTLLDADFYTYDVVTIASRGQMRIREIAEEVIVTSHSKSAVIVRDSGRRSFIVSNEYARAKYCYQPKEFSKLLHDYLISTMERCV